MREVSVGKVVVVVSVVAAGVVTVDHLVETVETVEAIKLCVLLNQFKIGRFNGEE